MKFRMILSALLLLPTVVMAQQSSVKPLTGLAATLPYRVAMIQEPVAVGQADGAKPDPKAPKETPLLKVKPDVTSGVHWLIPKEETLNYSYVLPAGGQYIPNPPLFGTQPQSNVRVNLNLRNAPLKEAVKQLNEQTKYEFVLEADAPTDARVTVVAKNIRLNTALDMLTDATGLNWNQQTVKKADSKENNVVFHLGKKVARNPYWSNFFWGDNNWDFKDNPAIHFNDSNKEFQWNGKLNEFKLNYGAGANKLQLNQKLNSLLQGNKGGNAPLKIPNLQGNQLNLLKSTPLSSIYTLGNSLVGTTNLLETHSTFTCPNCKHQITVVHQHQAPKCDKCGRAFHDDWDFCPFDGAKRPATASDAWQFCPICGKSIKPDEKHEKTETKPVK
ncbi:MAG: hypothetical protein JWN14_4244 [Chthonomonadales bacterium]|nr:hypothetical protein [Chthonomonadales bacterium]